MAGKGMAGKGIWEKQCCALSFYISVPEIPLPEFPCLNVLTRAMEGKGIWAKECCALSFSIPSP